MDCKKKNEIFICWSGEDSKKIATEMKEALENIIFEGNELSCFVSDLDIASGSDWWNKIQNKLKSCKMGMICITKNNTYAPWVYFEAGVMVSQGIKVIPLLIDCKPERLRDTPINQNQCVDFLNENKFIKMIGDIKKEMNFDIPPKTIETMAKKGYEVIKEKLSPVLADLNDTRIFSSQYIYPDHVKAVMLNTLYISAPMASIGESDYAKLHEFSLQLKELFEKLGFREVISPLFEIKSKDAFDGQITAIKRNFKHLKSVEYMLIVYPSYVPSSALVEIGYGIALSKKLVIFYKEKLPFMLEEAERAIRHLRVFPFTEYSDIITKIEAEGLDIFDDGDNVNE
ncbi:MAG: toll/interleukin-1 receptor domain-containing protein [Defluviitaleaceae bacterium]|nr:toll/interleukin-1 receptor domain-containing protein [Defluviitaleaceae bacterium]